jgi:flavin-dependent dehydrogenase
MFSYFFLNNVKRLGMNISVDMYEPKDFTRPGPAGCNMCGGIISESLVQAFASEGIILPPTMIQRGIDSYVLHMDVGTVRIETPLKEKRIGSVHRGGGPRDATELKWCSFDGFLQSLALEKGANLIDKKISRWDFEDDRPRVFLADDSSEVYDLLVVAVGANSPLLKSATDLAPQFKSPKTVRTYIREFQSTEARLSESLGSAMHVFLLDMPELEFAAAIPKGNFVSVCVLCKKDGLNTLNDFMASSVVSNCLASDLTEREGCRCSPKMNLLSDGLTFSDRIVFIGDSGVTRLYKDGIGAAYRTAKAAASTAAFEGVSANDFKRSFWITCREIRTDNKFGTVIFFVSGLFKKFRFTRKIMLRIVTGEQTEVNSKRLLSTVLWDMFTGSAPYKDIFYRTLKPTFLWNLLRNTIRVLFGSAAVQKI